MKKFVSMLAAVLMVITLSIPSFAYYEIRNSKLFYEEDGDSYIGVLKTSMLTDAQKDFMREWLKSDCAAIAYEGNDIVTFLILSSDIKDTCYFWACTSSIIDWGLLAKNNNKPGNYRSLSFNSNGTPGRDNSDKWYPVKNMTWGHLFGGSYFANHDVGWISTPYDNTSNRQSYTGDDIFVDYIGRLYFIDDDGLLSGEEPESEPDIPSAPDVIHVPADPPSFPSGETAYLPYDVSIWNDFTDYIRTAIGSVGVILILIVFLFIVIGTIYSTIKHYLTQGKSDGGTDGGLI